MSNLATMLGFDYPDRNIGETKLDEERRKNANLQRTLQIVAWGEGAAIVILLVVVFMLVSARQAA